MATYKIDQQYPFRWRDIEDTQVDIYVSWDGGVHYDVLPLATVANSIIVPPDDWNYYNWTVSGTPTAEVKFKVVGHTAIEYYAEGDVFETIYDGLSYFNVPQVGDQTSVTSTVNVSDLMGVIQGINPDAYFDSIDKFSKIWVYYYHSGGRQGKRIIHEGDVSKQASVSWSPYAQDGTWYKSKIIAYNHEGSSVTLSREYIDTTNADIYHLNGVMNLVS
jgi:hypothetical protein